MQDLDAQRPVEIRVFDIDDLAASLAARNWPAGGRKKIIRRQRRTPGGDLCLCGMQSTQNENGRGYIFYHSDIT